MEQSLAMDDPNAHAIAQDDAAELRVNEVMVRSGIGLRSTRQVLEYYSTYSDKPFFGDASTYNHDIAKMSICMALSASRLVPFGADVDLDPDRYLVDYLTDCGFEDLRADDYDKLPSLYTVATDIGHKTLTDENGESFTLLVVGVCGGNYKKEWLSNVTVGETARHQGFDSAARAVTDRIFGYLASQRITGRVKVWIAGFSRAAAIANLTAANLDDYGAFDKSDVFAYTFATPRNTTKPSVEGYENIFNIVGPMDPVPQFAPAAWGFGRYGNDLVLPGKEIDADFDQKYDLVRQGFEDHYGTMTNYNPKLNLCLRLLLGMFEQLTPSSADYDESAQSSVLSLLENKSVPNMLRIFRKLTVQTKDDTPEQRVLEDQLIESAGNFAGQVFDDRLSGRVGNNGSIATQVFHEHIEDLYLMWMHTSLTPEELFTTTQTYTYLILKGTTTVDVLNGQTGEELLSTSIFADEQQVQDILSAKGVAAFTFHNEAEDTDVLVLALSHDGDYEVTWKAQKGGTVESYAIPCSIPVSPTHETYVQQWKASKGDTGLAYRSQGSQILEPSALTQSLSSADIASIIGISHIRGGWRATIMRGILRLCLVAILIRAFIAMLNRWGIDEFWQLRFVLSSIVMIGLVESEAAYWLFAATPMVRFWWKALADVAVLLYCISCRQRGSMHFWGIFLSLLLCNIGDLAINLNFVVGVVFFALAHVSFIVLFQRIRPMRRVMFVWWVMMSVMFDAAVYVNLPSEATSAMRVGVLLYVPILLLLLFASTKQTTSLSLGAHFFVLSDTMLGLYFVDQSKPVLHMAYMAVYYLALLLICRSLLDEKVQAAQTGRLDPLRWLREYLKRDERQDPDAK